MHGPCRAFAFDVEDARCRLCDAQAFDLDIGIGDLGDGGDFIESGLFGVAPDHLQICYLFREKISIPDDNLDLNVQMNVREI